MSCLPPSRYWSYIGGLGLPFLFSLAFLSYQKLSSYFVGQERLLWLVLMLLLAGVGWSIGRQFQHLCQQAQCDPLTGLVNRNFWERVLANYTAPGKRRPLAVMLIDIDNFKSYNDRYGHLLGDEIIQEVAFHLVKIVRSTDTVGRYGGEEFVILVPDVDIPKARLIGERLVREIPLRMKSWAEANHIEPVPTISIGVTVADARSTHSPTELIGRADQAMYAAKRAGNSVAYVY